MTIGNLVSHDITAHDILFWLNTHLDLCRYDDNAKLNFMDFLIAEARYNGIYRLDDYTEDFELFVQFKQDMFDVYGLIFGSSDNAYMYWNATLTGEYAEISPVMKTMLIEYVERKNKED